MTQSDVKQSDDDILRQLVQWHEAAEQATHTSRGLSERDRDYVDNKQWTEAEEQKLKRRGQPVVMSNRIKPKIDFLKGQEQQRRMMPKAYPRTPNEEQGAGAATDALRFVMDQSKWDRQRSACFDNHIVEGACGVDIQVYQKQDGDFCIEPKHIHWDRMWGDPHSRERDWSDAAYKGQYVWMDYEKAVAKWPDKRNEFDTTIASEGQMADTYSDVPRCRWADPKRKRVRIAECWSNEDGVWYFTQYTKGGILSRMESPFKDEDGNSDDGFVFGSCNIDRDGNRYGVVRAWISVQDEINKRRSKAVHLMNVRQTWGNQAIGDKNAMRTELAKPDGHVEVAGGSKMGEDFGILPTNDMAEAQFKLLAEAKGEIDAVGVNAALSGNEERVMSGRALMARSEQGLSELGPVYDAFAQFQLDVYRKVWNRVRQFWTAEKWIRVTDDERNVKFVGLNQPLTLGEQLLDEQRQQGAQITPEMEQQAKMDPAMQQVVGTKNAVSELDVDIVLDDVPASATLETETFDQLMQIAPHAASMPPPMFEALIEAAPLHASKKEKILEKLRGGEQGQIPPQVQQQMQQADQAMQEMQAHIQELEQKLAQAQAQAAKAESLGPSADLARRELEMKYREDMLQAQKDIAILQVELKTTKATNEMQQAATSMGAAAREIEQANTAPEAATAE